MSMAIETHNLGKRYGDVTAVHDLSLNVREGEIYAFLGLNGAGKTTTIRLLLGMIKPTAGYVDVLKTRIQPGRRQPWDSVGYMVEQPHAYPELTVRENLEVARRLHPGVPLKAVDELIGQMGLSAYADRQARTLSHGNAQRLGLAKALLHNPRLLILDEPSNGLDPAGIVEIRELLQSMVRQHNVTVFMSSHILAEVARLADRIGIIHEGRLIQELNISELERDRKRLLVLAVRQLALAKTALEAAGYTPLLLSDGAIALEDASAIDAPEMIASLLVQSGAPPTRLLVEEEELEQYFLRLVGLEARVQND